MTEMKNPNASAAFTTPVLFLIFNRPENTKKVLAAIGKVKPAKLYIAADGPREGIKEDVDKCREVREIASAIDWDCDVTKLFRNHNLGCGKGPSSAISWFFEHETEGIILEDDCLPSLDFFFFCANLLERYRYDTRVMEIGGNNFEKESARREYSYYFSNMIYIWGWATWRRAWKLYDYEMKHYNEITDKGYLNNHYDSMFEREHYNYIFKKMHTGDRQTNRKNVWDYQWQFICKINSGLIIVPERNLVCNLGFGADATNTKNPLAAGHDLKLEEMVFPLMHPDLTMVEKGRDRWVFNETCSSRSVRMKSIIKTFIPRPIFEKVKLLFHKFIHSTAKGKGVGFGPEPRLVENQS